MDELERLWSDLHAYDRRMWRRCRLGIMGQATNLPGRLGKSITLALYHLADKFVKFN
jgi:hypothetical protein